jgi:hypothetical protein
MYRYRRGRPLCYCLLLRYYRLILSCRRRLCDRLRKNKHVPQERSVIHLEFTYCQPRGDANTDFVWRWIQLGQLTPRGPK